MTVARHNKKGKNKIAQGSTSTTTRRMGRWPHNYLSQEKAARLLGVHRTHLNRVLKGHRQSKRLLERYETLLAQHRQPSILD